MLPKSVSIKIEVIDPETGRRVAVMVDGAVPKSLSDSIGKYVSRVLPSRGALAEDGQLGETASEGEPTGSMSFSSMFGQVRFLLVKHFKYGYFTSRDVQDEYEWMLKGRLRSSTVSTYLLRLADPRSGIFSGVMVWVAMSSFCAVRESRMRLHKPRNCVPPKSPTV